MTRPSNTIADHLGAAQLAIGNTLADPEIQSAVGDYGYSAEKLAAGKALYDAAKAAVAAQHLATQDLLAAQDAARQAYQSLAKIARAEFTGDKARLDTLGLNAAMAHDLNGFLKQAATLFNNAADHPALVEYGYTPVRLAAEREKIDACEQANDRQEAAKGDAQLSTRRLEEAMDCLNDWTARYLKVAHVALGPKNDKLEKLGVSVRLGRAARKAAPKPEPKG